jgi:hypothetical protein
MYKRAAEQFLRSHPPFQKQDWRVSKNSPMGWSEMTGRVVSGKKVAWVAEPAGKHYAAVLRPAQGLRPRQDPDGGGVLFTTEGIH